MTVEQVLVVKREDLPGLRDGLMTEDTDVMLDAIVERSFFLDRPTAEISPQFKQIIPYVLIRHADSFYLLERTPKQTEARLHNKLSLGIGGHINPDAPELLDGLQKELEEEVGVSGDYDLTFTGILNDDSTEVGSVHLGVVYILDSHTGDVVVRETDKMTGRWVPRDELDALAERMETWSQIAMTAI
jgi:predicted NUDIX family phosphoesterase